MLRYLVASDGDDTGVVLPVVPSTLAQRWSCSLFQGVSAVHGSTGSVSEVAMANLVPQQVLRSPGLGALEAVHRAAAEVSEALVACGIDS